MFVTVHAAAAAIIGKRISSPIVAFFIGIISHFILDIAPHGDEHLGKKFLGIKIKEQNDFRVMAIYATIDSFCLAAFLLYLFKNFEFAKSDNVVWAVIGGILPDIIVAAYTLKKYRILKWFANLHAKNHRYLINKLSADVPLKYGIFMQICVMIILIWMIYSF